MLKYFDSLNRIWNVHVHFKKSIAFEHLDFGMTSLVEQNRKDIFFKEYGEKSFPILMTEMGSSNGFSEFFF